MRPIRNCRNRLGIYWRREGFESKTLLINNLLIPKETEPS